MLGEKPVVMGQEVEVDCVNLGRMNDGICKFEGLVIIIPKAEPGRRYIVKVNKIGQTVAYADIVRETR